jgi:hypothetical protein
MAIRASTLQVSEQFKETVAGLASETKSLAEMLGEFLGDTAIVVLVFYPLDLAGSILLTLGMITEVRRETRVSTCWISWPAGSSLFIVASLGDRRHAARLDSAEQNAYPQRLDAIERAILARLVVKTKQEEPRAGFEALTEDSPPKSHAEIAPPFNFNNRWRNLQGRRGVCASATGGAACAGLWLRSGGYARG